ncbi:site-specific integrase [uncultured Aquabacterium sp.]|uniref:tyrosine-type recombinase/integrase n=1 Tax=uncultured Aquabacterium sp. TaxID=158753 RepID=UPI0025EF40AA|nr:site-specific integrase [uncultured Aquabacterium sp.]
MDTPQRRALTDRELRAWLAAGKTDRGIGEGLTFVASASAASKGRASWILRYRVNGRSREKVLGRYPELSLKGARDRARKDREEIERGVDVAAAKQAEKARLTEVQTVRDLGQLWWARYIEPTYKHPDVVARVLRNHVYPVIGALTPKDVMPMHVDQVLRRIVANGAPTVANDALRYMVRMFKMAVRNHWVDRNPAADFEPADAGGKEASRDRFLTLAEIEELASAMKTTPNFGRENELAVWLLLALCVRKMELLSARWESFDLEAGIWTLDKAFTKTKMSILIPLADPVIEWLKEARVLASGRPYVFPARRLVRQRMGKACVNRFPHVSPDTLNVAMGRLGLGIAHFTVHDMRRTARTNLGRLGVDRFVAERALNHKLKGIEGTYDRHDYLSERADALRVWAAALAALSRGEKVANAHERAARKSPTPNAVVQR